MNLEGDVWWANSIPDRLVLRDASGAAELAMDLAGQPVQCGQRVRIDWFNGVEKQGLNVEGSQMVKNQANWGIDRIKGFWCHCRPFGFGKFMYAVLETGAKQYRVAAGDTVTIERLDVEPGKPFTFDRVLLINNEGKIMVGTPTVAQANVVADVVEHIRGPKVVAFKMKRRKGYHRTVGHRQELTVVKIKEIKV
jgi:large subunit ribosomal protein L21